MKLTNTTTQTPPQPEYDQVSALLLGGSILVRTRAYQGRLVTGIKVADRILSVPDFIRVVERAIGEITASHRADYKKAQDIRQSEKS